MEYILASYATPKVTYEIATWVAANEIQNPLAKGIYPPIYGNRDEIR